LTFNADSVTLSSTYGDVEIKYGKEVERMEYGYARVSTGSQNLDRQIAAIRSYKPSISEENIFMEKITGKSEADERSEYSILRRILRKNDELIIDSLDRLGRTKRIIKEELEYLKSKGVIIRVLNLPTTLIKDMENQSWVFELVNSILIEVYSSISEAEMIERERRQRAGIEAGKLRGVYKGRKPTPIDLQKFVPIYTRWKSGELKAVEAMRLLNLKNNTFYRTVQRYESGKLA
jgi:DNA invertase Pin-like site-specific DNA recombinase